MNSNIISLNPASAEPQPFDFNGHQVRVVMINGEPHFIASDLCDVLEIRNSRDALARLDADEKGVATTDTLGGPQQVATVNESGMYSLVLTSRKPEAKAFKKWVTSEVLPAIRKTGAYGQSAVVELTRADLAQMVLDSEAEKKAIAEKLEAAQPAVEYHAQYVGNDDAVTVGAWGAQYGLTEPAAFQLLRGLGIIRRVAMGDHWSQKKQRIVTDHEHRAVAGKQIGGQRTFDWFTLRPQHNVPRRHNGQVRQTLYIRQAHAVQLAKVCGLINQETA